MAVPPCPIIKDLDIIEDIGPGELTLTYCNLTLRSSGTCRKRRASYCNVKPMKIDLYRHPGSYGRLAALDVLVNGAKVGIIVSGETKRIDVSAPALIRVAMQMTALSNEYLLTEKDDNLLLHCGTRCWVIFDLLDLAYLPVLNKKVFFIRSQKRKSGV